MTESCKVHTDLHPDSGKMFRIRLADENPQAGYDLSIQGQRVQLIDWADRIEMNADLAEGERKVAVMFYAHRCEPNLKTDGPLLLSMLDLASVVYGKYFYRYEGILRENIVLVRESELVEA